MPHIEIKMLKQWTEEQKKQLAAALSKSMNETLGIPEMYITCSIEDFTPEEWQQVFKDEIDGKKERLYKSPEYDPKSLL